MLHGFYFDDDASDTAVGAGLRRLGVEVLTSRLAGLLSAPDIVHLEYAAQANLTVYTFNQGDFVRLHSIFIRNEQGHAGIVVGRQQAFSAGEQVRRLARIASTHSGQGMHNRIEFITHWGDDRETSP